MLYWRRRLGRQMMADDGFCAADHEQVQFSLVDDGLMMMRDEGWFDVDEGAMKGTTMLVFFADVVGVGLWTIEVGRWSTMD